MDSANLAIDIHTNKLLDWLISRRHVAANWSERLGEIREKLKLAIQDMPESKEIAKLLSGAQLNYYNCVKIVEILKDTESSSKNIFGYYSSQRMKDWQEIISLYRNDNIYLAEAAQNLIRNVTYEVPSRKKQEVKCEFQLKECQKKISDFQKQTQIHKNEYLEDCRKMGIEGTSPSRELTELLNELPVHCEVVAQKTKEILDAVNYYFDFVKFTTSRDQNLCAMLKYVQEKGNTTYFEYRTGEIPDIVEELKTVSSIPPPAQTGDQEIDFGDGIDFGDETGSESVNGAFVTVLQTDEKSAGSDGISWDLGDGMKSEETSDSNDRVARGFDAFKVLEFADTRDELINNIIELEGFLDMRSQELNSDSDSQSIGQIIEGSREFEAQLPEKIVDMRSRVSDLLQLVTSQKMRTLFLMKDNPKYVEKVVKKLNQKLENSEKCKLKVEVMLEKQSEITRELGNLESEIPAIISETKKIQKLIEEDVAERYKGRAVNIMGGVQVL